MNNIIIITGASSGIGREFAYQLDKSMKKIDEFWLVARRSERLDDLESKLSHKCRKFAMDITGKDEVSFLADQVKDSGSCVRMLINCAGFGILGKFKDQDYKDIQGMIRTNCESLTEMTYRMIPYMKKGSRIIQLASSAAFVPQINFSVYAATKSYVLSFSRSLREELRAQKIYVTAVCPGPVDTEFFEIAEKKGTNMSVKDYFMTTPMVVVDKALRCSRYRIPVCVPTFGMLFFEGVCKKFPHSWILFFSRFMK